MGFIGSMMDPGKGAGYQAQGAPILQPATMEQAQQAYGQTNQALANQTNFMNALGAANGIGNQSSVFNQLQGVANGTGPNPAQAMLANATGANTANQAALMAGQRGAGANTGLIARQAAMQGAANQQGAAGQGAALQAQQSLGALGQMGGIAGQQVAEQGNATNSEAATALGQQGNILGSMGSQNQAGVGMQSNLNNNNSSIAGINTKGQQQMLGGAMNGISALMASGGEVPTANITNTIPQQKPNPFAVMGNTMAGNPSGQDSGMFDFGRGAGMALKAGIKGLFGPSTPNPEATYQANPTSENFVGPSMAGIGPSEDQGYAKGGKVKAMVSPGERYLNPSEVEKVAKGRKEASVAGEKIPGKAKVKGDSLKNDTVPKTLEEGGIVLPKSVMESKHPHWAAHKFVSAILAKKQGLKR